MLLIPEKVGKAMLKVDNLCVEFRFNKQIIKAVNQVSFYINPNETVAIVGESGSGKSASVLGAFGLLPDVANISGQVTFGKTKQSISDNPTKRREILGNEVSFIFQEPLNSMNPLHRVFKQIEEVFYRHKGIRGEQARLKATTLLTEMGIRAAESRLNSWPHEFSGGERQRIMMAMALANNPQLLVADEPTTALDVTIEAQILDLGIVRNFADRVYVMKQGQIVETATTKTLFKTPKQAYTKHLLSSAPSAQSPPPFSHDEKALKPVICARDLTVHFSIGGRWFSPPKNFIKAIDGITFDLYQGETLGIVGESGSGKSTLALALMRLIHSSGQILFKQENILAYNRAKLRQFRCHMQMVFQDPFGALSPRLSVSEIIGEGLAIHYRLSPKEKRTKIEEIVQEVNLPQDSLDRYPHEFSGGQRQRIALARALILRPCVLILDEPTSALDLTVQNQIIDLLLKIQNKFNLSYIFISHDLKVIRALAHRVMVLRGGQVVEQGATQAIFEKPQNAFTQQLIAAAVNKAIINE